MSPNGRPDSRANSAARNATADFPLAVGPTKNRRPAASSRECCICFDKSGTGGSYNVNKRSPKPIMKSFIITIPLFLLVSSGGGEQGADSRTSSAPASTAPASSKSAPPTDGELAVRAFLEKASSRRAPAGEPTIQDITITFEGEANGDQHNEFTGTHLFLVPNRIRTKITNNSAASEQGFDGRKYWIARGDKVEALEGREYTKDRKQIDTSINQTNQLLQIGSLKSISQRLQNTAIDEKGSSIAVRGRLANFPTFLQGILESADATLLFDTKSLDLKRLRLEASDGSGRVENIEFNEIQEVRGVRFPFHIKAWSKSPDRPEFELQIKTLSWNEGLEARAFQWEPKVK